MFIVVKAFVEPALHFLGWADNRRMVHQCDADSPEKHFSGFEFRVLSPSWPVACEEERALSTLLFYTYLKEKIYGSCLFLGH